MLIVKFYFMIYLEDRSIISITGKDKLEFLQGMVTNDLNKLSNDNHIFCCLLSPTGKFLADFFIYQYGEMYLLDINKNMVKEILLKFKLYKLKREVFFVETDYNVFLDIDKTNLATNCVIDKNGNMIANDLRKNDFGTRIIDLKEVIKNDFSKDLQDYHQYRINNCVIDGYYDLEKDKSFYLRIWLSKYEWSRFQQRLLCRAGSNNQNDAPWSYSKSPLYC